MSKLASETRRIVVTSALPYANGDIHLGHLVEYLQTDMWVRFQKMRGHECVYVCADDTHGAAIMLRAQQEGITEEAWIATMSQRHQGDFGAFDIQFDHYGSTNSASNQALCERMWQRVRGADLVEERSVERFFDPVGGTFLADRFVIGTCPKCKSPNQYGDSCDKCGATYAATDLIDPRSAATGATPELRSSKQLFVPLEELHGFLDEWTQKSGALQPETAKYLKGHFLGEDLRPWDVSRPAPYFGFEIPDFPGNYWYVWFDAPIGYVASLHDWCAENGQDPASWWPTDQDTGQDEVAPKPVEVHHFIGRDIVYFHTLFWPAVLKTAGFQLPEKVHVHGFLTVGGEKMSKSKGTFIKASTYAEHLDPNYLRYYYASRLNGRDENIDLDFDDFKAKIDSDLVGKVVNLASRTARFVDRLSARYPEDGGLFAAASAEAGAIAAAYEAVNTADAMRRIMALADRANEYVEAQAPWTVRKDPARAEELRDICTVALNAFRQLVIYLAPVLPRLQADASALLHDDLSQWSAAEKPLLGSELSAFKPLLQRVDEKAIAKMVDASVEASAPAEVAAATSEDDPDMLAEQPLADECAFDDFMKVDLRVARILAAEAIPKAKKLLQLTVSLGGDETRNIIAGIKSAYTPEELVGRLVVVVANLAPRQMKFGTSEGMVIAAGPGGKDIFLLAPDSGAKPGMRVG
jgi:methionyl-tRNA synthetase